VVFTDRADAVAGLPTCMWAAAWGGPTTRRPLADGRPSATWPPRHSRFVQGGRRLPARPRRRECAAPPDEYLIHDRGIAWFRRAAPLLSPSAQKPAAEQGQAHRTILGCIQRRPFLVSSAFPCSAVRLRKRSNGLAAPRETTQLDVRPQPNQTCCSATSAPPSAQPAGRP